MTRTLAIHVVTQVGATVTLQGWVDTKRDHGKLTFIDLRDHTGVVQCVGFNKMSELTPESVVEITGQVNLRPENLINPKIATGTVEIDVVSYTVLNQAASLPIPIHGDNKKVSEDVRLKYRYLDLRNDRMQNIIKLRSDYFFELRKNLKDHQFTEVETPILSKATMEGARDFLVPSRFQPGKFYALPQSPQQYKQLLMAAGIYRYYQFARCFRDEDLRADRGFEFTQLDVEMSYVDRDTVMNSVNKIVADAVKAVGSRLQQDQFPVFTYEEAMSRFGDDKFDLRSEEEKRAGVLAFAWVVDFPMFKPVNREDKAEVRDGKSGWTFTHNPFSAPKQEHMEWHLKGENIDQIRTDQYDLVCNGYEVGGGSIRAHNPEVLKATYRIMGYDEVSTQASIGHMLEALSYGAPPHGGIALGLDRQVMLLSNEDSLKETMAFPMTATGRTAVMDAPNAIPPEQLAELGLAVVSADQFASHYDYIHHTLESRNIHYTEMTEDEAKQNQENVVKNLIIDTGKGCVLYVLPLEERADLHQLAVQLGVTRLALVSKDTLEQKLKLQIGAVPAFGSALKLPVYLDKRVAAKDSIVTNAAKLGITVKLPVVDYIDLEKPTLV